MNRQPIPLKPRPPRSRGRVFDLVQHQFAQVRQRFIQRGASGCSTGASAMRTWKCAFPAGVVEPGWLPTGWLVGTARISRCCKQEDEPSTPFSGFEWHPRPRKADVKRLDPPLKPERHPQPSWFAGGGAAMRARHTNDHSNLQSTCRALMFEKRSRCDDRQAIELASKELAEIMAIKRQQHVGPGQRAEQNGSILCRLEHDGLIERQHIVHQGQFRAQQRPFRGRRGRQIREIRQDLLDDLGTGEQSPVAFRRAAEHLARCAAL